MIAASPSLLPFAVAANGGAGRGASPAPAGTDTAPAPVPPGPPPASSRLQRGLVATFKILLPAVAGAGLALLVAWPTLWPGMERLRLGARIPVVALEEGKDAVIGAEVRGSDRQDRPFTVRADSVRKLDDDGEALSLGLPRGELVLADGGVVTLSARHGRFQPASERLELTEDVRLVHPSGYEVHSSFARIDWPAGEASGDAPVHVEGPLGTIDAEGFALSQEGRVIHFTGRARMVMTPAAGGRNGP